jgi:hypothetical protein
VEKFINTDRYIPTTKLQTTQRTMTVGMEVPRSGKLAFKFQIPLDVSGAPSIRLRGHAMNQVSTAMTDSHLRST